MFDQSPAGIVSLELAGTKERTAGIIDTWTTEGALGSARKNILIDFLFIPFYVLLFYTLCGSISVRHKGKVATLGVLLAFFSLIAGLFDVFENLLMLLSSFHVFHPWTAGATAFFAGAKFTLLFFSLLYVVLFSLPLLMKKFSGNS